MSDEKPANSSAEIEALHPPARPQRFTTVSGHPIRQLYTAADLTNWEAQRDLGQPGEPPNVQFYGDFVGGAERGRTADLLNAIQALSQLSYSPTVRRGIPANRMLRVEST